MTNEEKEMLAIQSLATQEAKNELNMALHPLEEVQLMDRPNAIKDMLIEACEKLGFYSSIELNSKGESVFIYSAFADNIKDINSRKVDELEQREEKKLYWQVNIDYTCLNLDKLDGSNVFCKFQHIVREMQLAAVGIGMYKECGYANLPNKFNKYNLESWYEMDQLRSNFNGTQDARIHAEQVLRASVRKNYEEQMSTDKSPGVFAKIQNKIVGPKQKVPEKWFKENNVACIWDTCTDRFWNWAKPRIKANSEFKYYKDTFPIRSQLDENLKEYHEYNIAFPLCFRDFYYTLLNEYRARDMKHLTLNEMDENVGLIYVHSADLNNWGSLAEANEVNWAFDNGKFSEITSNSATEIPIIYNKQDEGMVLAIINRLGREQLDYNPLSQKMLHYQKERDMDFDR